MMRALRASAAVAFVAWAFSFSSSPARGEDVAENYPDGRPHKVYGLDEEGRRNGIYKEFHPAGADGAPGRKAVEAGYRRGKLNGAYKSFFPDGKLKVICKYADDPEK